jgi:hypothetical protein
MQTLRQRGHGWHWRAPVHQHACSSLTGSKAVSASDPTRPDPASDVAREGVQQAIEDIVTAFTEAKLAQADDSTAHDSSGDSASDRTPVVIDGEAPH